jgi:hypothetical protein
LRIGRSEIGRSENGRSENGRCTAYSHHDLLQDENADDNDDVTHTLRIFSFLFVAG